MNETIVLLFNNDHKITTCLPIRIVLRSLALFPLLYWWNSNTYWWNSIHKHTKSMNLFNCDKTKWNLCCNLNIVTKYNEIPKLMYVLINKTVRTQYMKLFTQDLSVFLITHRNKTLKAVRGHRLGWKLNVFDCVFVLMLSFSIGYFLFCFVFEFSKWLLVLNTFAIRFKRWSNWNITNNNFSLLIIDEKSSIWIKATKRQWEKNLEAIEPNIVCFCMWIDFNNYVLRIINHRYLPCFGYTFVKSTTVKFTVWTFIFQFSLFYIVHIYIYISI